ncbi:DUF1566 domain-containing protein [Legionella sp. D16C41]|uniref:DUF1566 domain-containing protein n=1 Tax=Legionella sp. D16C41 TaxID=3402688 RepID=UPI003AF64867
MSKFFKQTRLVIGLATFFIMLTAQAGSPLWTITPVTSTTATVSATSTAIIQYLVTNQSRKVHTLVMNPIAGISQLITSGNCSNVFTLGYMQSCVLTLQVIGSALQGNITDGPQLCQSGNPLQCYQPSLPNRLNITFLPAAGETTLSTSVSTLALAAGGTARVISITNTGVNTATGVTFRTSSALPTGTTITPLSCGTILPGGTCVLTIMPGPIPSAIPSDIAPTPITLSIAGDNTNTVAPTLNILTYGSVYQSGFIFAIDDTTPITTSIGGKVAALVDQANIFNRIIWSSNGNGSGSGDVANDNIPGIYETSTNPPAACNGNTNGFCDTSVIVAFYSPPTTTPAVNLSFYAAGLCKATIGGYSDWYLPAICELGYDTTNSGSGCGTQTSPTLQNMQSNLVERGILNAPTGIYWSSTEAAVDPTGGAWVQLFAPPNLTQQGTDDKFELHSVRCARLITP